MIKVAEYKAYNYGFPSDDVDPAEKEKAPYILAAGEAFLSLYFRDEFTTLYSERNEMFILRKYGVGDQLEDTAMGMIYGRQKDFTKAVRKGWYNVNWEILKMATKYRNAFLGMFSGVDFEILCDSQDIETKKAKEDKAWDLYTQKKLRPVIAEQMGIELPEGELPEPDSLQEMLVYQEMGVYKNQFELATEKFIRTTFSTFSNWELETKRMVLEDLWDIGKAVVQDRLDPQTQKIKVDYCDIANTIIRKDHEGRILDGGVIKIKSISDVRVESALCGQPITEAELMEAGMACCGAYGNPLNWSWGRDTPLYKDAYGRYVYDNWKVAILDFEYRTSNTKHYTEKEKNGKKTYYREGFNPNLKDTPSKKRIEKAKICYYRGKLLLGTKKLYDYGQQYDLPRPNKAEALSSFHYIKLPGFSPVKVMKPVLDQVQIVWTKYQNNSAKALTSGYAVDEGQVKNTAVGSKLTADEIMSIAEQTGRLYFKSTDKWNHPSASGSSGPPIHSMAGGMGTTLEEFQIQFNMMLGILQEITGLTPQAVASPLPADTGKAVSEIQLAGTSTVLQPIIDEYKKLKQSVSKTMLLRGILTFKFSEEIAKDYYDVLGEDTVKILQAMSKTAAQIGVNLIPKTTREIRQKLEQAAQLAMAPGKDGEPGITLMEYLTLTMLIESSASPKYIYALMSKMINERKMMVERQKAALLQEQSKGNQQATIVATEGAKEVESFKTQQELIKIAVKGIVDLTIEKAKTENSLDLQSGVALIEQALMQHLPQQKNVQ
jgi:hypothetical protein